MGNIISFEIVSAIQWFIKVHYFTFDFVGVGGVALHVNFIKFYESFAKMLWWRTYWLDDSLLSLLSSHCRGQSFRVVCPIGSDTLS